MNEQQRVGSNPPESYAEEWRRQAAGRADAMAGATEVMLDMAGVSEGMRVLDLGAGMADQSIAAARRVGPSGAVLATDRDPAMLEGAREAVAKAGLTNVETRVMDAQAIDVEPGSFDAVITRMMLMLLPEPAKMLAGAHAALKPGGQLGAVVFASAERNAFLSVPLELARRAGGLPAPDPREPSVFALGAPGAAEELLRAAGFRDVRGRAAVLAVRPHPSTRRWRSCARAPRCSAGFWGASMGRSSSTPGTRSANGWPHARGRRGSTSTASAWWSPGPGRSGRSGAHRPGRAEGSYRGKRQEEGSGVVSGLGRPEPRRAAGWAGAGRPPATPELPDHHRTPSR